MERVADHPRPPSAAIDPRRVRVEQPLPEYELLRDHVAFYASRVE